MGLYGDVVACVDWGVGRTLETLREEGVDENTFIAFLSDTGPWYVRGEHGGNATPFRASKSSTFEGGFRVPCVMRHPARIPPGLVSEELATAMDLLPTCLALAGASQPERPIDGKDLGPSSGRAECGKPPRGLFLLLPQRAARRTERAMEAGARDEAHAGGQVSL